MKILMVSDHYEPHIIGGAETHLQILSRELKARGHAVSVATARIAGDPERETRSGIPVLRIGNFPGYRRTFLMASGTAPGRVNHT